MQTLGDRLRNARIDAGFTLKEVSEKLTIPVDVLTSMEAGSYGNLPAPCFSQGFLKSYGELLGLDTTLLVLLHKQETQEISNTDFPNRLKRKNTAVLQRFVFPFKLVIQSEVLSWAAIVVVILLGWIGYSSFISPKNANKETEVQASTVDLRLEKIKSSPITPVTGYRINRDPASVSNK